MEQRAVVMDRSAPGALVTERLEAEITTLAAHLTAAECRWLQLVAEFDRRQAWPQWGCRTCAFWLSWKCGLDIRCVQEKLRVARVLDALPLVTEAFATGRLSYSKVRAITRIATPENEAAMVDLALHATAAHVEAVVRAYRGVLAREEETARAVTRRANRSHHFDFDDDDLLSGHYRLTPEDGAVFMAAVDAAAEQVRADNPDVGYGASLADALIVMAESYLANGPAARKSADRYQVVLSIDGDVLAFDTDGECALHNGPALAAETARRLSCDASAVLMVRGPTGEVLDIGRKTRTIPPRSSGHSARATPRVDGLVTTRRASSPAITATTGVIWVLRSCPTSCTSAGITTSWRPREVGRSRSSPTDRCVSPTPARSPARHRRM